MTRINKSRHSLEACQCDTPNTPQNLRIHVKIDQNLGAVGVGQKNLRWQCFGRTEALQQPRSK
jgi:hypothetical protein